TGLAILGGGVLWIRSQTQDSATLFTYFDPRGDLIEDIAWVSNGQHIASVGANVDRTVQIWDATTGNNIISHPGSWTIDSSPDGTRIASADYGPVEIWDVVLGNTLLSYSGTQYINVSSLAWSPNDMRIASVGWEGNGGVQIWDTTTGKTLLTYSGQDDFIH